MNRNGGNSNSLTHAGTNVAVRAHIGLASSLQAQLALPLHALPPTLHQSACSGKTSSSKDSETTGKVRAGSALLRRVHACAIPPTTKHLIRNSEVSIEEGEHISSPRRPCNSERGHLAIAFEIMDELEAEFSR